MRAIPERTPRGYQRDLSLNDPAPEEPEVASSEVTQSGNSLQNSTRKGPNSCSEMGNCNAWTVEAAPAPIDSQFVVYLAESISAQRNWSAKTKDVANACSASSNDANATHCTAVHIRKRLPCLQRGSAFTARARSLRPMANVARGFLVFSPPVFTGSPNTSAN